MKQIRFHCGIDLQAERSRAGLTQQQLADKAQCHVQSVRYWEGQRRRESIGGIAGKVPDRLADALGLDVLWDGYIIYENRKPSREADEWLWGKGSIFSVYAD